MKRLLLALMLLSSFAYGQVLDNTNKKFPYGLAAGNGVAPKPTSGLTAGAIWYTTGVGFQYYDGSAWQTVGVAGAGVTSFNSRTGAVTLTSGDVTTALGFTPVTNARTVAGFALTSNITLGTLTFGTHLTGTSYNGSSGVTLATDATSANTLSTIMARDASGNFSSGLATVTGLYSGGKIDVIASGIAGSGITGDIGYFENTNSTTGNGIKVIAANGTRYVLSLNDYAGINAFTVLANGNTTVAGTLTASIGALGTAGTTFLTQTAGLVQSRTAAQVLSDIGAGAATGGTGYIQNQNASAQTSSNFWISGTGIASNFSATAPIGSSTISLSSTDGTGNHQILFKDIAVEKWGISRNDADNSLTIVESGVSDRMKFNPGGLLNYTGGITATGALAGSNFSGSSSGTNTGDQTNITGTAGNVTGIVAIANGGTGSATQNFVDLTTAQNVGGVKTFTSGLLGLTAQFDATSQTAVAGSVTSGVGVSGTATTGGGGRFINASTTAAALYASNTSSGPLATFENGTAVVGTILNSGSISSTPQGTLYGTATGSITSAQLATSLTNETGTGVAVFSASPTFTGTVLGDAATLSGNISALNFASTSWTPTDASGAGLTLANVSASYQRIGNYVICTASFDYPTTADASATSIGGFPFTSSVSVGDCSGGVSYSNYGSFIYFRKGNSSTDGSFRDATGTSITNVQISGKNVNIWATYKIQ